MRNIILTIVIPLYSLFAFSQEKTTIRLNIPQQDTTTLHASIFVLDPLQPIGSGRYQDTLIIKNGQCHFTLHMKNPSLVYLTINNKYVTFPGVYGVIVEPSDNLVFDLPDLKEAGYFGFGILKTKITGKGSEKLNLTKNIVKNLLEIYKTDLPSPDQNLDYKYKTTDRKLEVIDSLYRLDKMVPLKIKDLIKANLYAEIMSDLNRTSLRSKSDSVRILYKKFIVNKRRTDIFFKKNVIKYAGLGTVPTYLILTEYGSPKQDEESFRETNTLQYAKLLVKRLQKFPEIKDYLLSDHLISSIRNSFDSTTTNLYEYYCKEADFNNPNYSTVTKLYVETENKFAIGKPFYDFSLPDSTGKLHALKDFKGKVLVIDFWYNGCGGCRLMVPALEEIEKEMGRMDVKFISIGIDKRVLWLEGIGKYSSKNSLQLFTDGKSKEHPMMKYLNIYSYPRLIIVDKKGNIVSAPPEPRTNKDDFVKFVKKFL
ncbi:TlpA family protein disulfide reductase [Chryseobacterium indologenes]|uniref:TlpA family protein disulfide reductase n=1 Tax=Chryseobacterium indologenes TaxID=253 RepID=UPI001624E8BB|nr:TlpA disulfide reductase family protein [Chryseobacterium indologenes]